MNIITTTELNAKQIDEINELIKECALYEHLTADAYLSSELNFNKEINAFYLLYVENKLVSFLTMFIPTPELAEISAYTSPVYRNKNYFTALFTMAVDELKSHDIPSILFVHEPSGHDAKHILEKLNACYDFTEYSLVYNKDAFAPLITSLKLKPVDRSSKDELVSLTAEVYKEDKEITLSMADNNFNSSNITLYAAFLNETMIGVCNINRENDHKIYIFGVGISPQYQNLGYGRQMMNLLLSTLHTEKAEIILEVSSTNAAAFHLYTTIGFSIKAQYDYYRYTII